jgi:integrase
MKKRSFEHFVVEGHEHVYRKPTIEKGRWWVRRRRKTTGRLERVPLEAESWREACAGVREMARKEQERADAARKNQEEKEINEALLGSALDEWLATLDVRESTRKEYEYCVTVYKNALGEDVCVADITLTDVERAFTSWAPRSGRTKMKHLAMLARFFRWAKKHAYCKRNPAEEYEAPAKWRKQVRLSKETTGKVLETEDARALLAACKEPYIITIKGKVAIRKDTAEVWEKTPPEHLYLFVLLALRSGLRAGNLLGEHGLRWDDVDLERGIVHMDAKRVKKRVRLHCPAASRGGGCSQEHAEGIESPAS